MRIEKSSIGIILSVFIILCGCTAKAQEKQNEQSTNSTTKAPQSDHFTQHFQSANKFLDLIHEGAALRKEKKYDHAIKVLEEAYEKAAFGRIEKAIALEDMAMVYEDMGSYSLAANFYDGAAKTTMNPKLANELSAKAASLHAKSTTQESTYPYRTPSAGEALESD